MTNRISLYTGDLERRLATFDHARFPINDVAFHPTASWLAIGTGSYDGGYQFEGELFLWNWETGEHQRLLAESREVVRCRFVDAGKLAVLLRPRDEEEYGASDPFATYVGGVLDDPSPVADTDAPAGRPDPRLADLQPIDPRSLGFDVPARWADRRLSTGDQELLRRVGFEERHRVWDVAWLGNDRVAAVHDCCQLEIWRLDGHREVHVRGEGHGVQVLRQADRLLVHVLQPDTGAGGPPARSCLVELRDGSLVEWRAFPGVYLFSVDRHGRILVRDARPDASAARRDRVLDPSGAVVMEADLGGYDGSNHHLRLDGGRELYFLRGAPPAPYLAKRLCAIDEALTVSDRGCWDGPGEQLVKSCAAFGPGDSIVRGYQVRLGSDASTGMVDLYSLSRGQPVWRCEVGASITAVAASSDARHVIVAQPDGHLRLIDASDGRLLHHEALAAHGVPTAATALALAGDALLVGTIDGRLLLYALERAPTT
ncbi:MAG TPA: PQQ-binding-like beta-propeller repeat protein [Kofleriaceae bacterium]|nr:PQQ-binding-like beta-propeller repeat protein [Kofleriaceae bacterium]